MYICPEKTNANILNVRSRIFYNPLPLSARRKVKPQNNMKKILLTLATVFVLTACGGGAPSPTGDAEKDAKAVFEYMTSEVENCKTLEEFNDIEKKIEPIQKEFEDYEKDHPEYKEQFQKASQNEALKFIGAAMKKEQELKKKKENNNN